MIKKQSSLHAVVLALLIVAPESVLAAESACIYLGSDKVDVTPPIGTPLSGYAEREGQPSIGIHDPLFARALSLKRGNKTIVSASADLVLIDDDLRKSVLRRIRKHALMDSDELVLSATHTHSGAGAIGN